jgi:hypothetical protein
MLVLKSKLVRVLVPKVGSHFMVPSTSICKPFDMCPIPISCYRRHDQHAGSERTLFGKVLHPDEEPKAPRRPKVVGGKP